MAAILSRGYFQPAPSHVDGRDVSSIDELALTANPTAADTLDFRPLPPGAFLHSLKFHCTDVDTNGSPTIVFRVGYRKLKGSDVLTPVDNYFAPAGQTTLQAGGVLICAFKPILFEVPVILHLTINTAAATFQAGTVTMVAEYKSQGPK